MSNFLQQTLSTAQSLGIHITNNQIPSLSSSSINQTVEHVGKHSVLVKLRLAEG
jgi:hypothetical protein